MSGRKGSPTGSPPKASPVAVPSDGMAEVNGVKSFLDKVLQMHQKGGKPSVNILDPTVKLAASNYEYDWPKKVGGIVKYRSFLPPPALGFQPTDTELRPSNLDALSADEGEKDVFLVVCHNTTNVRGRHWAISWETSKTSSGTRCARAIEIRSLTIPPLGQPDHLMYWGPITAPGLANRSHETWGISLSKMSKEHRQELENISWMIGIPHPFGDNIYNCHNWMLDFFRVAVARNIFTKEKVMAVFAEAFKDTPKSKHQFSESIPFVGILTVGCCRRIELPFQDAVNAPTTEKPVFYI